MTDTPADEFAADRMQRLLSRAVEEQVSEQRQATTLLSEVRASLTTLEDGLRAAASQETVERLDSSVSTVVADLRTSTALLSQRLEALAARVEQIASETAVPVEQTSVRLGALAAEIAAQAEAVGRVQAALVTFEAFPTALAALQRDMAGLHDRLAPLGDLQAAIGEVAARTASSLDSLRPQLDAVATAVAAGGSGPADVERVRDAVVDALGGRFERLEEAAARPVVSPQLLRSDLGDLRASVRAAVGEELETVTERLAALHQRVDAMGQDLTGASTGPDLGGELARLTDRVDALVGLPNQVDAALAGISALRSDSSVSGVRTSLEAFADGAAHLSEQVARITVPSVDDISGAVSARVADRLVEVLAPRIADVVLTRVSAALVTQLGEAIAPRLREENDTTIRAVVADSERRVLAHVDEAVLALAEALLRRKGLTRSTPEAATPVPTSAAPPVAAADAQADDAEPEPAPHETVHEVVVRLAEEPPAEPERPQHDEEPAAGTTDAPPVVPVVEAVVAEVPVAEVPVAEVPVVEAPVAEAPVAEVPVAAPSRPSVTTGLAPAPAAPAPVAPVPSAGSAPTPARRAPAKTTASPGSATATPPAKATPTKGTTAKAVPARSEGPLRPARSTRNVPILDATPDLAAPTPPPLPARPASARPAPPATPRPPATSPAPAVTTPAPAPPPSAQRPVVQPEPEKKKRWWRAGE